MAPKRKADDADALEAATRECQRIRSAISKVVDGLLCPIKHELPLDPVIAEDNFVYERSAIEEWLERNEKSPHTNEPMGKRLFPALQVKNMIKAMVKSGALSGSR